MIQSYFRRSSILGVSLLLALVQFTPAVSAATGKGPKKTAVAEEIHLDQHVGETYFSVMTGRNGIKEMIDRDLTATISIEDPKAVRTSAKKLVAPEVYNKVINLFAGSTPAAREKAFDTLAQALRDDIDGGAKISQENLATEIRKIFSKNQMLKDGDKMMGLAPLVIAPMFTITEGKGAIVRVSDKEFYSNVGYLAGIDWKEVGKRKLTQEEQDFLAKAVKSGRTFSAGPLHGLLDASDTYYLKSLTKFLDQDSKDKMLTVEAIFDILTRCDTTDFNKLGNDARQVATDFLAIYTAELDRHVMANLASHPWENDLAEATFISFFIEKTGFVIEPKSIKTGKGAKLIKGVPADLFGIGTAGSGIGVVRQERRALQLLVTNAMEHDKNYASIIKELRDITGVKEGDVVQGLMVYLNDFDNQAEVKKNAERISKAMKSFVTAMTDNADDILKSFTTKKNGVLVLTDDALKFINACMPLLRKV